MEKQIERSYVRSYLPWLVAAGALVLFFLTQNNTLSLTSLPRVARLASWDWQAVYAAPLYYLVTLPICWMPSSWHLMLGNLFSMLCAALSLALLARSVALLPQDRTREQRQKEISEHSFLTTRTAWLPPLLAVFVCGLQLSFWELATVADGEMLDLLLFAYCIRCLLEYRVDRRESWISKMALVYGLGIANNWAMIGYFPLFLIATAWIMGLAFFRYRFMVRTSLFGLAGLLLYLVLPLIHWWADPVHGNFWSSLHGNLGYQKQMLGMFRPYMVIMLSLSSLLPLLMIGIRWPSSLGDISAAGFAAASVMMYVTHALFFGLCVYIAFDPVFSPRQMMAGSGIPLLTYYYVGAICIGYFCAFFLLMFSNRKSQRAWEKVSPLQRLANQVITSLLCVAVFVVPVALGYRNIASITSRNSDALLQYGRQMMENIPNGKVALISDDPILLYTMRALLGERLRDCLLLDTTALPKRAYHTYLKGKYGNELPLTPVESGSDDFSQNALLDYLTAIHRQTPVYYLHPSFGYYFERFYAMPKGLVYEMKMLATNTILIPPMPVKDIQEQEQRWDRYFTNAVLPLSRKIEKLTAAGKKADWDIFQTGTAEWVGGYYSCALNNWGVWLRVNHQTNLAIKAYYRALSIVTNNPCAFVNLEWTRHAIKTGKTVDRFTDDAMNRLAPYSGNWDLLISLNGPLDEPTFRQELARVMARNNNHIQAAQQALRILEINPKDTAALAILGNSYVMSGMPDKALELIASIKKNRELVTDVNQQVSLVQVEAWAWYCKGQLPKSVALLTEAQGRYSQNDGPFFTMGQIYMAASESERSKGDKPASLLNLTNALRVFEKQIKLQPGNSAAYANLGVISAQLGDNAGAAAAYSRVLESDPANVLARMNRALAEMTLGNDDKAVQDFNLIIKQDPGGYKAYFCLGEIAWRKQDWWSALDNYENYSTRAPVNTREYAAVKARIAELKGKLKR